MDHAVGRLVETLKLLDQIDNTIVVFASDNGAQTRNAGDDTAKYPGRYDDMPRLGSNYPLRGQKGELYEGGIRTPAVIKWPGRLPPRRLQEPVHITDWMPTFAALLGCKPPADPRWDGENILPLLTGESDFERKRPLYWNLRHSHYAVCRGDWKLVRRARDGGWETELFHLGKDTLEERNLAGEHPQVTRELTELVDQQHRLDDTSVRPDVN